MEQEEQGQWGGVNQLLQLRGFKPVIFADPTENKSLADVVLLDRKSAAEVRATLRTMLSDSERWRGLVQELIQANNLLRLEVQQHRSRAAQQSQRASELQELLDSVRSRVQELEERCLRGAVQQLGRDTQQLQEAQRRCRVLEQKLSQQKEEAAQLQRKLCFITREEERRLQHHIGGVVRQQSSAEPRPAEARLGSSSPPVTVLEEIRAIISDHGPPSGPHRQQASSGGSEDLQELPATLKLWAQQLQLLKALRGRLNELWVRLLPWQPWDCGDGAVKVEDLMLQVDTMLEKVSADDDDDDDDDDEEEVLRSPTRSTLVSMVSHFQKLFDVPSLRGVYPRMSEVYTRLGELSTAMRNLRDLLDLDRRASAAEVVNQVATLVSQPTVGGADVHSIIMKVKQHDRFFPAFHGLVTEMLQTLGVSHLDDIIPALRALTESAR